jgi:hypothetical protein
MHTGENSPRALKQKISLAQKKVRQQRDTVEEEKLKYFRPNE